MHVIIIYQLNIIMLLPTHLYVMSITFYCIYNMCYQRYNVRDYDFPLPHKNYVLHNMLEKQKLHDHTNCIYGYSIRSSSYNDQLNALNDHQLDVGKYNLFYKLMSIEPNINCDSVLQIPLDTYTFVEILNITCPALLLYFVCFLTAVFLL